MLTAAEMQAVDADAPARVAYEVADGTWRTFPLTTELLHDAGCSRTTELIDDTAGTALGQPVIVCSCGVAILLDQGGQL